MELIYSKHEPRKLLHIVNRFDEISGRQEVIPEDEFLQLATLQMDKGKTFRAHKHIWKEHQEYETIAQESWVVIQGSVTVLFYDLDGLPLGTTVIRRGDCSVTLEGGHNYEILEDDTIVYEYKTGPYTGQINDKVFL